MKYVLLVSVVLTLTNAVAMAAAKPNPFTEEVVAAADAVWNGEFWKIELRWIDEAGDARTEDEVPSDEIAFEPNPGNDELWAAAKEAATLNGLPTPTTFRVIRQR